MSGRLCIQGLWRWWFRYWRNGRQFKLTLSPQMQNRWFHSSIIKIEYSLQFVPYLLLSFGRMWIFTVIKIMAFHWKGWISVEWFHWSSRDWIITYQHAAVCWVRWKRIYQCAFYCLTLGCPRRFLWRGCLEGGSSFWPLLSILCCREIESSKCIWWLGTMNCTTAKNFINI